MFAFFKNNKFTSVNVNDLERIKNSINLIDIRKPYEYVRGFVPGAKNVPMSLILSTPEKHLDKSKQYHIICQSGGRSLNACQELSSLGYDVVNVSGGTGSYVGSLER
ncbi:MAG: rhodanese-like domain-containing protein [Eubacteriaceae bacterium]